MASDHPSSRTLAEAFGEEVREPSKHENLYSISADSARAHPDRLAIISRHQPNDLLPLVDACSGTSKEHLRWAYSQLQHGCDSLPYHLFLRAFETEHPLLLSYPTMQNGLSYSGLQPSLIFRTPLWLYDASRNQMNLTTILMSSSLV